MKHLNSDSPSSLLIIFILIVLLLFIFIENQNKFPNVQKLTAVYIHKETEQEVEVEGIEFFNMEDDKIFS